MSRFIVAAILFVALVAPVISFNPKICLHWKKVDDGCPRNETKAQCGKNCEPTCQNLSRADVPIVERCPHEEQCSRSTIDCTCEEGFVRNAANGRCYIPEECPRQ